MLACQFFVFYFLGCCFINCLLWEFPTLYIMNRLVDEIVDQQHIAGLGFVIGVLVTLAYSVLPSIWHCPTNPLLGQMVQLRKKRFRLAGQNGAFGQFELKDHYGLEQQVLNLDFDPRTMWMNVGFWKVGITHDREPSKSFSLTWY